MQDCLSQPAQYTSFDDAKPKPVDQQGSSLPDDFVLENEIFWLDGMVGKIRFQLQERIEPVAAARKDGRALMPHSEGGLLLLASAILGTTHGFGPFTRSTLHEGLFMLQAFMGVVTGTILVLAAVTAERQRAAAAAHEQRERLHVTLASIGDAVLVTDSQGRVTFLNPVAAALTGWPEAEAMGKNITEVSPAFQRVSRDPRPRTILETFTAPIRAACPDGAQPRSAGLCAAPAGCRGALRARQLPRARGAGRSGRPGRQGEKGFWISYTSTPRRVFNSRQPKISITNNHDPLIPMPFRCISCRTCSMEASCELCSKARRSASNSEICWLRNS